MASWTQKRKEKAGGTERIELVYVHYHVQNRGLMRSYSTAWKLSLVLCDNLEEWDVVKGRREAQEGGDMCIPMADSH